MVSPFFASATATSAAVPVREPSGSPWARTSAFGVSTPFKSASVMGVAGAAAGGAPEVCPNAPAANASSAAITKSCFIRPLPFPDWILQVRAIDDAHDPEQTHRESGQHHQQTPARRRSHPEAQQTDNKA